MANPFTSKTAPMMSGDWQSQQQEIDYQRKLAEKLAVDTDMPQGQVVGGQYVAPAWTQMLAKALNPMWAKQHRESANEKATKLADAQMAERTGTLERFSTKLNGSPAVPGQDIYTDDYTAVPAADQQGYGAAAAVPGDRNAAMAELGKSRDPLLQQLYMAQMLKEPDKPVVVGRSLLDPRTGKQVGVDSTWQGEQQAAREAKKAELEARLADQRTSREEAANLRRELAANASADRRMIAGMVNSRAEQKNVPKLPTSALKMQQEELDAIGTASSINADLGAMAVQIESGKLKLGMVDNLAAKAKNFVGASDESSRNLASFQATLEKLRNDSLRLNKGVQTEGDAQRAWNEMLTNINDPKLVKQRLAEIQKINERAANLRGMNVETIRQNFGVDPLDTAARKNVPAAVGGGGSNVDDLLKKYGG